MTWHFTRDAGAFRTAAGDRLAAAPARHTTVLTLADGAALLGWWTEPDGAVTGTCVLAAPDVPVLGVMARPAARALARTLPGVDAVTGVRGETDTCGTFARQLGRSWRTTRRMRLFRLGEPTPPCPPPPGRARPATAEDVPLAVAWTRDFARGVGEPPGDDHTPQISARVADGRLYLWEDEGVPVSMAGLSPTLAGQARVSLVYTPPERRGRGYAGAVTSTVGRVAADAGAAHVLLFTDLANPTSNALYPRLGYRPVCDHAALSFTAGP
ncbi:GNAT family N-acetyltransferase [Streptomyces sp. NBC_01216]|uniref:GNAT family N-acetyltransferase n=1 Tax=unclassified Streptomyces TaxID=2593676 RepID=UPI002E158408|nr:GNAT family N-acetyltransferase [Streptomyces sp. NBC_01216]